MTYLEKNKSWNSIQQKIFLLVSQISQPLTPQNSQTAQLFPGKISSRPKYHFIFSYLQTFLCLQEQKLCSLVRNSFLRGVCSLSNIILSDPSGISPEAPNGGNPVYEIIFIFKYLTVAPKPFGLVLTFRISRQNATPLVLLKLLQLWDWARQATDCSYYKSNFPACGLLACGHLS